MIPNLLAEILGGARRLAGSILILIVAVYVSGFIIVNAYLWKFGIARLELFQPPFVATGLLFVFMEVVAALFVLPLIALTAWLFEFAHAAYYGERNGKRHQKDGQAKQLTRYLSHQPQWIRRLLVVVCLALGVVVYVIVFPLLGWGAMLFVTASLDFATGAPLNLSFELKSSLEIIAKLHGIAASLILLLAYHRRRLGFVSLSIAIALTGLAFLFVQTYTLLSMADGLYEQLPVSFGGGRPARVLFLIDSNSKNEQLLKELEIPFDSPATDVGGLLKTKELLLIWQLTSGATDAETIGSLSTYVVRSCETCRAVEFPKALVQGAIHIQREGQTEEQP